MNQSGFMNLLHGTDNGLHKRKSLFDGKFSAVIVDKSSKSTAFKILHYHVSGIVGIEKLFNRNHTGIFGELSKHSRFTKECFKFGLEFFFGGISGYDKLAVFFSFNHFVRKEFLDGNFVFKQHVKTDVRNSEASHTENISDKEFAV